MREPEINPAFLPATAAGYLASGKSDGQLQPELNRARAMTIDGVQRLLRCRPAVWSVASAPRMARGEPGRARETQRSQSWVASRANSGATTNPKMGIWRTDVSAACVQARMSRAGEICFLLKSQTDSVTPANSRISK